MSSGAPRFGSHARLILIFLLSLALHAVIIFGLGFNWQAERARQIPPMIEITLAQQPQKTPPQDFDFLAQANQNGGGKAKRAPKPQKQQQSPAASPPASPPKSSREKAPPAKPKDMHPKKTPASVATHLPDIADILNASARVAASPEFSGTVASASAQYPSERRIDARTRSSAAAEYLRQWVEKVERIGNLNYPREARERDLSGRLILAVTLRPDGSVYSIDVLVPSPYSVLNQAAKRIVKLAEPYARVPSAVLQGHDLLVITRSWEFDDASRFSPP